MHVQFYAAFVRSVGYVPPIPSLKFSDCIDYAGYSSGCIESCVSP